MISCTHNGYRGAIQGLEGIVMKTPEEIKQQVAELAYVYEKEYGGCSQCVVGAFKAALDSISDDVFKAATGLAGGIGLMGSACGALTGGVMVLSTFLGREYADFKDPEKSDP